MKYQFIEEHRQEYPVTLMCQILEVARTGYYKWRKQPLSARKVADLVLLKHIQDIFEQSRKTYGSYPIHTELAEQGIRCGRKRVARLMRTYNLKPKTVRSFKVVTTDSNHKLPVSPNRLKQQFSADRPDQLWLTDTLAPERKCRCHLCSNGGRMALSGGGSGRVFSAHCGLGYE